MSLTERHCFNFQSEAPGTESCDTHPGAVSKVAPPQRHCVQCRKLARAAAGFEALETKQHAHQLEMCCPQTAMSAETCF